MITPQNPKHLKLKERYSTLITFSVVKGMKLATVVDALRRKHEAVIPRLVGRDLLAKVKLILKEKKNASTTCSAEQLPGTVAVIEGSSPVVPSSL